MLIVKDLSIERLNKKIFENINLSLSPGNITILKGKNGSGKTTLLKTILNIMVNFGERIYSRWKTIKREKRLYWNSTTGSSKLDCLQKTSIRNRLKKFGDGLFCKNIMCLAPTGHTS